MYVYLITGTEKHKDRVKIGVAANPKSRLKELQTGSPETLEIRRVIKIRNRSEAFKVEAGLHKTICNYLGIRHIHGEWFESFKEIEKVIDTCIEEVLE